MGEGHKVHYTHCADGKTDSAEAPGQPGPHRQLGTALAGESRLLTTLEAFPGAALSLTGPRTAHLLSQTLTISFSSVHGFQVHGFTPVQNPQHADPLPSSSP